MNKNVKTFLVYTGILGASISALAYLVITWVIVVGFTSAVDTQKQILFAVLGSFIGLMITGLLRGQGITFARKEEESQEVMKEYHVLINKTKTLKQMHTIKHYIVIQTIKDFFIKGITFAVTTFFILYIFMDGNGDFGLFLLAIANLLMFTGFGLVALSKGYDRYLEEHIPVIKQIIVKLKETLNIKEVDEVASVLLKEILDDNLQQCKLLIANTTSQEESS